MGKPKHKRSLAAGEVRAVGRMLRGSPQKLNLVAQSIRGMKAEAALNDLSFSRKRIALAARKVLHSAVANAENNHDLDIDALVVSEAYVGKSLVMKRWRPRARGRASPILKPFSQLTVIVREAGDDAEAKPAVKKGAVKKVAAKKVATKKVAVKKSATKKAVKGAA